MIKYFSKKNKEELERRRSGREAHFKIFGADEMQRQYKEFKKKNLNLTKSFNF